MKTLMMIRRMKEVLTWVWIAVIGTAICLNVCAQTPQDWKGLEKQLNFYMANDLGRNGYYDQKPIAELMGEMADVIGPECVFAAGDVHHFEGVRSVNDPLWMTNYELIYSHPELMIDWFPILGNHEYRGNTQAVLDYTNVSRRWSMPGRYYTKVFEKKGTAIRFVMIDTAPLIDKYRNESETYPDACKQDMDQQLAWIDSVLTVAKEDWVVVIGHHPIYAETSKDDSERSDMQKRLDPILRKHKVDIYACGHIHNFQHLRVPGSDIDYVVNSAGSLSRKVKPVEGTLFCSPEPGFSIFTADKKELDMHMIDKKGKVIYTVKPGTQTDTKIRLKGKGVPSLRNKNVRGDHYVTFVVQVPTNLNEEAKEALRKFDEACGNRPKSKDSDDFEKPEKKKKSFMDKLKETFED